MKAIRIIATPPGEAPENIRAAWIGVEIPLPKGKHGTPRQRHSFGVLSGPKSRLMAMILSAFPIPRQSEIEEKSFIVSSSVALDALEKVDAGAASWWQENVPQYRKPGWCFAFPESVCEKLRY